MHVESERVGERVCGGGRAFEIGADNQLACRFGMTVHVQFTQCGRGLANLPHTHFVERNVDLSLQPVLRVVCGASVAHQCDGTHVWRHGLIMVEFDVSGHASPLSAGCLSDLLPVCRRIRIAGTAHTKTCLPHDFREGTFR